MDFKDGGPLHVFTKSAAPPNGGAALFSDRDGLKNFVGKKIHDADL